MEKKKNSKFDLESKRKTFFFYGLIVSLTLVLFAFKAGNEVKEIYIPEHKGEIINDIINIPSTSETEKLIAPPPILKLFNTISIVDNNFTGPETDFNFLEPDEIIDSPISFRKELEKKDSIFYIVEQMPEFPGGELALRKWIARKIEYPQLALQNGIKGKVYVTFIVDTDGGITNVAIARGVDPFTLDKEALRVVSDLPKWKPGKQRGKAVKVAYTVPINFDLQ